MRSAEEWARGRYRTDLEGWVEMIQRDAMEAMRQRCMEAAHGATDALMKCQRRIKRIDIDEMLREANDARED